MTTSAPLRLAALTLALGAAACAHAQSTLNDVVVTATRTAQPLTDVVADVSIIDRETLERSGATGLVDVLARLPGVELSRNGGSGGTSSLYVRGGETRFTAVYIDGVRVDSQSTGGAPWEALPLALVDRIEVLRGPAAAVYGSDAMSGVVQIFTRKGEGGFKPFAEFGLGSDQTRKLDLGATGTAGAFDYTLGYSRELSEGYNAKRNANPDKDGYNRLSVNARLGWQIDAIHRLEATVLDSKLNSQYDGSATADDHSLHHLRTAGLSWLAHWNDIYDTRLSVSEGQDRYETSPSAYLTKTRVRNYLWQHDVRLGAQTFTAALERREDALVNNYTTPAQTERSQNALALGYGIKWQAHTLQLNARHDRDSELGGKSTGSAAYAYSFAPNWRATASAGNAFRAPTLFQRFSIYGDPSLKAETARNTELGLKYQQGSTQFSATLYRNKIDNLIAYVSGPGACINGSDPSYPGCYGNTKRAQYQGLTLAGSQRVAGVNLSASLDLQNPRDLDTDKQLARRARRHANLSADTRVQDWTLGSEIQLSSSRWDDVANTKKMGGYGLVNLYASTAVTRDWTLLARIDNVADKHYETALNYITPGRTFYVGLKWLPL